MTIEEVRKALKVACAASGSQARWSHDNGLSQTYVSDVILGKRPPSDKVLNALGLRQCYVRIDMRKASHGGFPVGKRMSYRSWNQIIQRCTIARNPRYNDYGGRGITVCERWLQYSNFAADMGEPPAGFQIERKDNNAGYSLENCIWADSQTQNRNKRNTLYVTYEDIRMPLMEACDRAGIDHWSVRSLARRMPLDDAFAERVKRKGKSK